MTESSSLSTKFNTPKVLPPHGALTRAVQRGDIATVKTLLEQGADANEKTSCGNTVLMHASLGHPEIALLLIEHGARIDETNDSGYTAVMWAVLNRHPKNVRQLIDMDAALDGQNSYGFTTLMYAAQSQPEIACLLIDKGAPLYTENKIGNTALDLAKPETAQMMQGAFDLRQRLAEEKVRAVEAEKEYIRHSAVLRKQKSLKNLPKLPLKVKATGRAASL